jgi:two-component system chemotaxis response regulator CheY
LISQERWHRRWANILVVDDAAFMRLMIKDILTKGGYRIIGEAANGIEAVEQYRKLKPDLV